MTESLREADSLLTELEALWPKLNGQVTLLGQRLETAQRQLETLKAALRLWRENSDEWERLSQDSQAALTRAQTSLDELTKRYDALSRAWSDYKTTAEAQVKLLERKAKAWRTVAIAGGIGALAAGLLAGLLIEGR